MKDDIIKAENIQINWNEVKKLASKTKIFKGHFNPLENNKFTVNWSVIMSVRNSEKTTAYILLGMLIYQVQGFRIEYCRMSKDDIRPKDHNHFFDSIIELGYIERITGGMWNSVVYKAGFWFYRNIDENGNEEISSEPFMHVFAIKNAMDMKSNYTSNSMFLIFDEFEDPTKFWRGDEFTLLCDCISTIFRKRVHAHINLLGNTLNLHSSWFSELCISRQVLDMKQGDSKICNQSTDLTPVFVSILPAKLTDEKLKLNKAFFNFKNPKLEAITGTSGGWSMRSYPKLPKVKKENVFQKVYVNFDGFRVRLDFINCEGFGLCINVVPTFVTELEKDCIEITTEQIFHDNQIFLLRNGKISGIINNFYYQKRIFYANNEVGVLFDNFMQRTL